MFGHSFLILAGCIIREILAIWVKRNFENQAKRNFKNWVKRNFEKEIYYNLAVGFCGGVVLSLPAID